jgi:8-oxo-dGTP pyrophosphatase MutT (NUDIX family)
MREKRVVVAVVQDEQGRFLVAYNPKWGRYTFPMKDLDGSADVLGSVAIRALEADLACKLPDAKADELEYLGRFGPSGRTGDETEYEYWLYAVDPGQPLDLMAAPNWNNNPPLFLSFADLTRRTDLTWSTTDIVRELVENQEVVLAVIARPGERETEFLLVWNNNYGGYFFPAQRIKTQSKPERVAVATVRSDLGYRGPATAVWQGEAPDIHSSQRFQRDRRYRFHICAVQLPEVDLHQPCGPLERALDRRSKKHVWCTANRLADPAIGFSPTMQAVRQTVVSLIPAQTLAQSLRHSEGGIALFERKLAGKTEWLAQWNENWQAFFFIGGHRHEGETFRDCVLREIGEELDLAALEFTVASQPCHNLEYKARSRSADELTAYTMELFAANLSQQAAVVVDVDRRNRWLSEEEILRLEAYDARPISPTVYLLLCMAGKIQRGNHDQSTSL